MARLGRGAYARLPTERPNPAAKGLDRRDALTIAKLINAEDAKIAAAVRKQAPELARGINLISSSLRLGGRLLFVGAGTSGRLGVLEAAECPPTFGTRPWQIQAAMAGGRGAVFRAVEGAEDDERRGRSAARGMKGGDVVVGIAASGVTPYVRGALAAARGAGAATILVTCNGHSPNNPAAHTIAPDVGPEIVAGSTRLKSATACKMVLNTLTTGAMVRLGKVYDQWMVDLKLTNHKLRLRAERIVCELARVSPSKAAALLQASNGSVKLAVVMGRLEISKPKALALLSKAGGNLRRALAR